MLVTSEPVPAVVGTKTKGKRGPFAFATPQAFSKDALLHAYSKAEKENLFATDDSALLEKAGYEVKIINDTSINFKITTREDWIVAEALFNHLK